MKVYLTIHIQTTQKTSDGLTSKSHSQSLIHNQFVVLRSGLGKLAAQIFDKFDTLSCMSLNELNQSKTDHTVIRGSAGILLGLQKYLRLESKEKSADYSANHEKFMKALNNNMENLKAEDNRIISILLS